MSNYHDGVIKWKHFPCYWPFVRGIHRSPVYSLHKGQWRGALVLSLICTRINVWVNNGEAGDLRRYRARYDVTVKLKDDEHYVAIVEAVANISCQRSMPYPTTDTTWNYNRALAKPKYGRYEQRSTCVAIKIWHLHSVRPWHRFWLYVVSSKDIETWHMIDTIAGAVASYPILCTYLWFPTIVIGRWDKYPPGHPSMYITHSHVTMV